MQRLGIHLPLDLVVLQQRAQLGGEGHPRGPGVEEERLLPQPVARQYQPPAGPVPQPQREHPPQLLQEVQAVAAVELEDHLGVRARAQLHAAALEVLGQGLVVVDLAVEGERHRAVGAEERLVGLGAQIDDRQAGVAEDGRPVPVQAIGVGAAVIERGHHPAHHLLGLAGVAPRAQVASYATHGSRSASS
jgi:hypothetical protein